MQIGVAPLCKLPLPLCKHAPPLLLLSSPPALCSFSITRHSVLIFLTLFHPPLLFSLSLSPVLPLSLHPLLVLQVSLFFFFPPLHLSLNYITSPLFTSSLLSFDFHCIFFCSLVACLSPLSLFNSPLLPHHSLLIFLTLWFSIFLSIFLSFCLSFLHACLSSFLPFLLPCCIHPKLIFHLTLSPFFFLSYLLLTLFFLCSPVSLHCLLFSSPFSSLCSFSN